jgi:two-component system phosphate regulon sensor histidine kinase PhoR
MQRMETYRRDFIGNVSHELKTPIFTIQGFSETLLDGALEDERVRRSFVEKIRRNAHRLGNLARDLTEIARLETSGQETRREPFDLLKLVREVMEAVEPVAEDKRVTLHAHLPTTLPKAYGDPERIRQVVTNLVENGIRYNNEGGRVELSARATSGGEGIKLTVADNGIGVAPEHLPRLTERFYRVDTSRSRNEGGTGLGLAIVKHVLQAHDAKLLVESTPGRGTTFGFTLATTKE